MRRWCVARVVIMVYLLGLILDSHRGATFPFQPHVQCVCRLCRKVREWLRKVLGEDVAQDGVEELVGNQCIAFFVVDGLVATRCPDWLQSSFNTLITLFGRIGLRTNNDKTKVMTCLPGKI
jgi:hypothetical protein